MAGLGGEGEREGGVGGNDKDVRYHKHWIWSTWSRNKDVCHVNVICSLYNGYQLGEVNVHG